MHHADTCSVLIKLDTQDCRGSSFVPEEAFLPSTLTFLNHATASQNPKDFNAAHLGRARSISSTVAVVF